MHPADAIRGTTSRHLQGKIVVLAVTGSIAAVETVKLARELIRHGSDVVAVMSDGAREILHPNALEFATGHPVITGITGAVEHVDLCGGTRPRANLLLIAPCTANTISKISQGIDDTPVTTFATTALGAGLPLLLAPAMDETMYRHPVVRENLERLRRLGVEVVEPKEEEDKAKLADLEGLVAQVLRRLGPRELVGKRVLVIGGATVEPIDAMRVVSNRSTGATAVELAREAHRLGGEVELWMGHCEVPIPEYLALRRFDTGEDLLGMVPKTSADYCLMPAAVADFIPRAAQGKIPSDEGTLTLRLDPAPKVIKAVRSVVKGTLVGFKAEAGVPPGELKRRASQRLEEWGAEFVVANDVRTAGMGEAQVLMVDREGRSEEFVGPKALVAEGIWGTILHGFKR